MIIEIDSILFDVFTKNLSAVLTEVVVLHCLETSHIWGLDLSGEELKEDLL